jgi:two-component system NtrC family response regulator
MKSTILIIDDDEAVCASMRLALKQSGYTALAATSPHEALRLLKQGGIGLVVQDMNFGKNSDTSGTDGITLLQDIKGANPALPVVLITAWGSIDLAVRGMKYGAADFLTKPWANEQLIRSIETALHLASTGEQINSSRAELDAKHDFTNIIGNDPALTKILTAIARIAPTDAPVLITGESGTGKECIADALHRNSHRHTAPFVKVNVGSITPTLFESEIFGHVKGAFTDAKFDREGRFEAAHTGTLFLDEIGDMAQESQVKLLRVLQDRTFQPVGSSKTKTADVRVVSATNRNLAAMIQHGTFREDLFYRLNLITLHLPPLRERKDDIPLLAQHFLNQSAQLYNHAPLNLSNNALRWLREQNFSGNIRELKHLIERTVLMSNSADHTLTENDFLTTLDVQPVLQLASSANENLPRVGTMSLDEIERAMILKAIEAYPRNITQIAEALGISRNALYRRLEKYDIHL